MAFHNPDLFDATYIHTAEANRRALRESAGIWEVGLYGDLAGEHAATTHEDNKDGEGNSGGDNQDADFQLGPFQLLLARQQSSRGVTQKGGLFEKA